MDKELKKQLLQGLFTIIAALIGAAGVIIAAICNQEISALKAENSQLKETISALTEENSQLKDEYTDLDTEQFEDDLPDFDWDYECFDGANLCIITHDGDLYSANDISLGIGRSEAHTLVICEKATSTIWAEVHPLASYLIAAFFDFGEYSRMVSSAYTQLPGTSSPGTVEIVHIYLP